MENKCLIKLDDSHYAELEITPSGKLLITSSSGKVEIPGTIVLGNVILDEIRVKDQIFLPCTLTDAGSTGSRTINKISGSVWLGLGETEVTVINTKVSKTSIVQAVLMTNDPTARIRAVERHDGSFTIFMDGASSGEVEVGFIVFN